MISRRKILGWLGGSVALLSLSTSPVAVTPTWIQKRYQAILRGLAPGESKSFSVPFSAEPGDYAEITSNADGYGLILSSEIDAGGNVVINVYNPTSLPVSASLKFSVRLYKK